MSDIKATYRATRSTTRSQISIDADLSLEEHQMIVWILTHPDQAHHLIPAYRVIRSRPEQEPSK